MVLDFVNRAGKTSNEPFAPYYEATPARAAASDPNKLSRPASRTGAIQSLHARTGRRNRRTLPCARAKKAPQTPAALRAVKGDRHKYIAAVKSVCASNICCVLYINLYAFLLAGDDLPRCQSGTVVSLRPPAPGRALPPEKDHAPLAVSELVDLDSYRVQQTFTAAASACKKAKRWEPLSDLEGGELTDPRKAALSQIIQELNERFGTDFTEADRVFFAELKTRLAANDALQASARVNPPESVRLLHDALLDTVLQTMIESNFEIFEANQR